MMNQLFGGPAGAAVCATSTGVSGAAASGTAASAVSGGGAASCATPSLARLSCWQVVRRSFALDQHCQPQQQQLSEPAKAKRKTRRVKAVGLRSAPAV
jgi:hypothetical protein